MRRIAALAALLVVPAVQAIEFKPRFEAEGRWFYQAQDEGRLGSVASTIEAYHDWGDGQRLVTELFTRWDFEDDARTHADVRELYYQATGDDLEFRLGMRRVFWGVTESRHLVDIVNQSDFVENINAETKLGQPMMDLALIRDLGTFEAFLLPYERSRTFPGPEGYPRLPFTVEPHDAKYQSPRGQTHVDYALRYAGSFGPLDIGVAWFDGTAREPRLEPCVRRNANDTYVKGSPDGPTCPPQAAVVPPPPLPPPPPDIQQRIQAQVIANLVLIPYYDLLRQASIDAQYVIGSMALKTEVLRREQQGEDTWATVSGFEYTFGDIAGSGIDVGVLGEYLYDQKHDALNALNDDEIFVGSRLAVNDVAGTQVLAGAIASREDGKSRRYGVEASRRLTDDWKLSVEARIFSKWPQGRTESFLADQDFVTFTFERFF